MRITARSMEHKMECPKKFTKAVKSEYPDWPELHAALDRGSQMVGRYLEDSAGWGFRAEIVLEAIDNGTIETLKPQAEQIIRRRRLVEEYDSLIEKIRNVRWSDT